MKSIYGKSGINLLFLFSILLTSSCAKNTDIEQPMEEEYVQRFDALISGKPISIRNSYAIDRTKLNGQWTGVNYGDGSSKELYRVKAELPKEILGTNYSSNLVLQIEHVKVGDFKITGKDDKYETNRGSHVVLYFRETNDLSTDPTFYTANPQKAPFDVQITRYEFPNGSIVPIVGGKFKGTLYNEKNGQDSVVIQDGNFEVRF